MNDSGQQPDERKTFKKSERIQSKKLIRELFEKGSSFFIYPFRVIYLPNPDKSQANNQVLISVPKKKIKKAVERNLIKRRIREAYRLNKSSLFANKKDKSPLLVGFIFVANEVLNYHEIESKLKLVLLRLKKV